MPRADGQNVSYPLRGRGGRRGKAIVATTRFRETNLSGVSLRGADAAHTSFDGANLQNASLHGAPFQQAEGLDRGQLDGARADTTTTWPDGFDATAHGVWIELPKKAAAGAADGAAPDDT